MKRETVLEQYISTVISNYSNDDREDQIAQLLLGNWSEVQGWKNLSDDIRKEFDSGKLKGSYRDKKYDEVLKFKLRDNFKGFSNEYLSLHTGINITYGEATDLESCPCCGYKTLEQRNNFEICTVCWWEDDGQDNDIADEYEIGPNDVNNLTVARFNYLKFGIYNPKRTDLLAFCDDPKKYIQGRVFKLKNKHQIIELDTDWIGNINESKQ